MRAATTEAGSRCDSVMVSLEPLQRCVYLAGHWGRCRFSDTGPQDICGRTSINFTQRTIRTCALPADHISECVYLWLTERPATLAEMRRTVIPK